MCVCVLRGEGERDSGGPYMVQALLQIRSVYTVHFHIMQCTYFKLKYLGHLKTNSHEIIGHS